jgi:radical SAM protein with 4Fe4S-binding SPASM domain
LIFEVTRRCNLTCPHCYNLWQGEGRTGTELNTEQTIQLLAKVLSECHCGQVAFTGGEPTLRVDLEVLIASVSGMVPKITLITNGTALAEERILSLRQAGVGLFELPLNGPDAASHDAAVGGPGNFRKTTRTAGILARHGIPCAFVFVATRHNIHQWEATLELGMALGARAFLFNRYNAGTGGQTAAEKLMPTPGQVRQALEIAERFTAGHGVGIAASIPIPPCLIDPAPYPHVAFGFCAAGSERAYLAVDPLGNLRPCNHSLHALGNLREASLADLLGSPAMRHFCQARPAFCGGCPLEAKCQGGCKAAGERCGGTLEALDPFLGAHLEMVLSSDSALESSAFRPSDEASSPKGQGVGPKG